jgi:hypothetical protein
LESNSGGLDAGEMLLRPLDERRQLCPFVGDGLTFGVVLVIGIRAHRRREEGLEIPCHVRKSGADLISFLAQALGRGLKIKVRPSIASSAIGRGLLRRSGHLHSIVQTTTYGSVPRLARELIDATECRHGDVHRRGVALSGA